MDNFELGVAYLCEALQAQPGWAAKANYMRNIGDVAATYLAAGKADQAAYLLAEASKMLANDEALYEPQP